MPTACCVPGCPSRISGHKFPREEEQQLQWRMAIGRRERATGELWSPGQHTVVCKLHFKPEDYRELEGSDGIQKRLKNDAVPSLFPHEKFPSRPRMERKRRRTVPPTIKPSIENFVGGAQRHGMHTLTTAELSPVFQHSSNVSQEAYCKPGTSFPSSPYNFLQSKDSSNVGTFHGYPYCGLEHYFDYDDFKHFMAP